MIDHRHIREYLLDIVRSYNIGYYDPIVPTQDCGHDNLIRASQDSSNERVTIIFKPILYLQDDRQVIRLGVLNYQYNHAYVYDPLSPRIDDIDCARELLELARRVTPLHQFRMNLDDHIILPKAGHVGYSGLHLISVIQSSFVDSKYLAHVYDQLFRGAKPTDKFPQVINVRLLQKLIKEFAVEGTDNATLLVLWCS